MPEDRIEPPIDSHQGLVDDITYCATDAAPHFYTRRPVRLCTDGRDDDDDGPPNWADRDADRG